MDMVCIYCGSATQVTNSRLQKRVNSVWRRRTCQLCKTTFTTIEQPDLASTLVIKRSQRHIEPFERDKLFISIYESCKHRPQALRDATALMVTAVGQILKANTDSVVGRDELVAIVYGILERFDVTAATVYNAYHPKK